jgi:hypothetical protein
MLVSVFGMGSIVTEAVTQAASVGSAAASTCGPTNVALNQPATASSLESGAYPAAAAVDGNTGTRWSSAWSDPQWLEVDLGSTQQVCQVVLDWEAAYATAFQIQVSPDGTNWTTIYSTTTGTGGNQTLNVNGSGRYIRMYGTARATGYGYSLWEFQVFAGVPTTTTTAATTTTTVANNGTNCAATLSGAALSRTGWTASSNTNSSAADAPANAIDGNPSTRFSSDAYEAAGQELEIALGSARTFNELDMDSANWPTDYARDFNVEVSSNGSSWTTVASCAGTGTPEVVSFPTQSAAYVEIVSTGASSTSWWSIGELNLYSGAGTTTTTTSPSTTVASTTSSTTAPATTTTTVPSSGGSTLAAAGPITGVGGLCLDDANASSTAGNKIDDYTCNGSTAQIWTIASNGTLQVLGGCLDETGTTSGSLVDFNTCDSAASQTWTHKSNGEFVNSASGLCLDDPGANTSPGAVQQEVESCTDGAEQQWNLPAGPSTTANQTLFGPNVYVFTPSMPAASVQSTVNAVFGTQQANQFGTQRYAELFAPGSYNVQDNVGFYTSVAGLGSAPDAVNINGGVTVDAQWMGGNATDNFWRSASNMEVTPTSGTDYWAVAQAGPFRRMDVNGALDVYPSSYGYASGGYIADTRVSGQVASASQQQFMSRNSQFGSWSGGVWNMVFSGVTGAPAASFPNPPETVVAQSPVTREEPYLYVDSSGNYHVFVPSVTTNTSGTSWAGGSTPGSSLAISSFFIANPSDTAAQINSALAAGDNLIFTPGVYQINQTLNVTKADTVILGLGFPTLIPQNGVNTMSVADVNGVSLSGLIFDAGPQNSAALLTVGTQGSTTSHASDPATIQDVFFRIGGAEAGSATASLIDNSSNSIIDDVWAWRADHGNGVGWTANTAANGVIVNGANVTAYGLFVEHYQQYEVQWNGNGGTDIFFQNEMPYDVPNQSAWMENSTTDGYASFLVAPSVTSFHGYGMGSYCYFNVADTAGQSNPPVVASHSFEAPQTSGVVFSDLATVSLGGVGTIENVINATGGPTPTNTTPADVASYS